jgi:hypothetical protein
MNPVRTYRRRAMLRIDSRSVSYFSGTTLLAGEADKANIPTTEPPSRHQPEDPQPDRRERVWRTALVERDSAALLRRRLLRDIVGSSDRELADAAGCSPQLINHFLHGRRDLSQARLEAITQVIARRAMASMAVDEAPDGAAVPAGPAGR